MGNHIVHYKRLPENSAPLPAKMDVQDPHTISIEMETVQEVDGKNGWLKGYTRLDPFVKGFSRRKLKPVVSVAAICIIIILLFVLVLNFASVHSLSSTSDSVASNKHVFEMEEQISLLQKNVTDLGNQLSFVHSDVQKLSLKGEEFISLSGRVHQTEDSIAKLNSKDHQIEGSIAKLNSKVHQVEDSSTKLSSEIHHSLNLYKNCKEDTSTCSIGPDRDHINYWRDCPTRYLPLHQEVCC